MFKSFFTYATFFNFAPVRSILEPSRNMISKQQKLKFKTCLFCNRPSFTNVLIVPEEAVVSVCFEHYDRYLYEEMEVCDMDVYLPELLRAMR